MENRFFLPIVILASMLLFALIFFWPKSTPETPDAAPAIAEQAPAAEPRDFSTPTAPPQIDPPVDAPAATISPSGPAPVTQPVGPAPQRPRQM